MDKIILGAQLYTVRDHIQTDEDFERTMAQLAEMGVKYIHASGIGGKVTKEAIRRGTKDNGIEIVLTHYNPTALLENYEKAIEYHDYIGTRAIGIGGIPYDRNYEGYMRFCENFAPVFEKLKASGRLFLYHNHHLEFEKYNGRTAMDWMLENTDPEGMKLTFDAYWAHYAGIDPIDFVEKHGERIFCTHTKDMTVLNGSPTMTEMLTGNINYDGFFEKCREKNVKYHFIEQDICRMDSMESMKISFSNLMNRYDFWG